MSYTCNGNPLTNNIENFSFCSIFCRYDFADSKFSLTTSIKLSKSLEAFFNAFNSRWWKFCLTLIVRQCFTNVLKALSSLWTTFCNYCFVWFFLSFFSMPWVTAGDTRHASSLRLRHNFAGCLCVVSSSLSWNWQQNWFERYFHWVCQHHFFNITSAACVWYRKKTANHVFLKCPIHWRTVLSWWFRMMRQLNGCSCLAWRSSATKQCIERTGWND